MRRTEYRIIDEPEPGRLSHLSVDPLWPLLASMLGGLWLGLPWFLLNSLAFGSATRRRELLLAGGMGALVLGGALFIVGLTGPTDPWITWLRFLVLGLQLLKLATYYGLHTLQVRSFALHQHFGGRVRSGLVVVIAGAVLRGRILDLLDHPVLVLVAS